MHFISIVYNFTVWEAVESRRLLLRNANQGYAKLLTYLKCGVQETFLCCAWVDTKIFLWEPPTKSLTRNVVAKCMCVYSKKK